jgi:hypothetical protein
VVGSSLNRSAATTLQAPAEGGQDTVSRSAMAIPSLAATLENVPRMPRAGRGGSASRSCGASPARADTSTAVPARLSHHSTRSPASAGPPPSASSDFGSRGVGRCAATENDCAAAAPGSASDSTTATSTARTIRKVTRATTRR